MARIKTLTIVWPDRTHSIYRNKVTRLNYLKFPFFIASILKEMKSRGISLAEVPPLDRIEGKGTDHSVIRFERR